MSDVLNNAGFSVLLDNQNNLSEDLEKGYRIIYLTDRNNWRQKIIKRDVILQKRRIESVKRHRQWQKQLTKDKFYDEVFS